MVPFGFRQADRMGGESLGAIFTMLLRKSSATGGGDYYGARSRDIHLGPDSAANADRLTHLVLAGVAMEGQPAPSVPDTTVGRWAGDRVALVGDYDESKLWEQLPTFRNITADVVRDWNDFVDVQEMKLKYDPTCSCNKHP